MVELCASVWGREGGRYMMLNKHKPIDCLGVCKDPLRLLRHE